MAELQLALADDGDVLERADRERLGEDLRKLYVALTRARHATWVGLAPLANLECGAFGYLLGGGEPLPDGVEPALRTLCGDVRAYRRRPGSRAHGRAIRDIRRCSGTRTGA
jgi:exodeoxyribonuclease V beta subunit